MSNLLKDVAILLFSAGEEIEAKSTELRQEREKRFNEFEEKLKSGSESVKSSLKDEARKARDGLSAFTDKLGIATRGVGEPAKVFV